jgi:hypothetical protein
MSRNHSTTLSGVVTIALLSAALQVTATPEVQSPLTLGKLETSRLTAQLQDAEVRDVFQILSRLGEVPFVLAFNPDPSLKMALKAENMPTSAVLASLRETYGFQYESTPQGIVVTRSGEPAVANPVVIGVWPPRPGPTYQLQLEIRNPDGTVLANPMMTVAMRVAAVIKFGSPQVRRVTTFDRERLIGEPRAVGTDEIHFCVNRETTAGLELFVEAVAERPVNRARFTADHMFAVKVVGLEEATLFRTEDGRAFILKGWTRQDSRQDGSTESAPAAAQPPLP